MPAVKLFVGGLSFSTSTERLRETFARFGGVASAAVMTDRETGRSRGFGFVEMASPEEAEQAIGALNGSSLDGRTIRVDKATPRGAGGPRPAFGDRRPAGPRPSSGPGGPRGGFGDRPSGGGGPGRGGFGDRPPAGGRGGGFRPSGAGAVDDRPGRGGGFGEPRRTSFGGDSRRGPGGGQGDRRGGQREKPRGAGSPKKGPQRRSEDRGRRSLGDEGGYRPF